MHLGAQQKRALSHPQRNSCPLHRSAPARSGRTPASTTPLQRVQQQQHRRGTVLMWPLAAAAATAAAESSGGAAAAGKHAVVVGAGPAGALAATILANQGYSVDVFERRKEPEGLASGAGSGGQAASIGPRSYNILLNERAAAALDTGEIELSDADVPPVSLAWRHKTKGGPTEGRSAFPSSGRLRLANRGVLAGALVRHCLAKHPQRVRFHFSQELASLDLSESRATFQPAATDSAGSGEDEVLQAASSSGGSGAAAAKQGGAVTLGFDLLLGADGAGSSVRAAVQALDSGFQAQQTKDVMEFRTCVLGPAEAFLPPGSSPVGSFQTWANSKLNATFIGSSTADGQLRSVFILPEGVHATLKTPADYEAYLASAIPSLPADAVQRAAKQLVESPISNGGFLTRCSKLNSGRVVLVGDAAHSVYPALGQGANAALEGAATLGRVLQELGPGAQPEAVAAEYSRRWLPNAHAVVDLTVEAFGGNKRAFAPNLKLVQLITQFLLHKLLPFLVPQPSFSQINSTTVPYSAILEASRRELRVFKAALAALGGAALAWGARVAGLV